MFCKNCGKEIPDGATFCPHCGVENQEKGSPNNNSGLLKKDKDMILALIISFIFTGLGVAYAGNKKKGIILFVLGIIFAILGMGIFSVIAFLIWAYGLYATYNEVKIANGESNPNLIEDFKTWDSSKKIGAVVAVVIILLIVIAGSMSAFSPKTSTSDYTNDDYTSKDNLNSDSVSSSSGSGDSSYSSSSNGHDVSSHYEGEYGSSDLEGTVNDDGSVDAHETGHTDYGDYEINSHMDSDGHIHGTVDVGGKTYYVEN